MVDSQSGEAHVELRLSAYLSGELDTAECDTVERHLAGCPACLAEADEIGTALAALLMLPEAHRQEVVDGYLAAPAGRAGPDCPQTPAATPERRGSAAGTGPPRRPGKRRRRRLVLAAASLALAAASSTGLILGGVLAGSSTDMALAAVASNQANGASLLVYVAGHGDTVTVRTTVSGLHPGAGYRLYVLTTDGRSLLAYAWTGTDATQNLSGDVPCSSNRLSSFTVSTVDGAPVVAAYIFPSATPVTVRTRR